MRHEQNVQVVAHATLERIKQEYTDLLKSPSLSLQKLFAPDHFSLDEFCKKFTPHPQSDQLKGIAQVFGENYGIWLANAKHHITCALFLYPTAHFERMLTMMKNLIIDFYLNDVMGRDTFKFLTHEQQETSRKMLQGMAGLNDALYLSSYACPLELANADVLREFRDTSSKEWFRKFLRLYCHHINITHLDRNADALGHIPGIYEYVENRCHLAGMHHIVLWIEYSDGQFLEWDLLKTTNIAQRLKRLHWVTAAFGALSNDLFSFEKEVVDNNSDSNLVMIIVLNHPGLSLKEAILRASGMVRGLLIELLALMGSIKQQIEKIADVYPALALRLNVHLNGIVRCVQASWMWQVYTKRYKRPQSIWEETRLVKETSVSGA